MMKPVSKFTAGLLLLLGFWCLGRALETSFNRDPRVLEKRETITAGILLGVPALIGGGYLLWECRQQRRQQEVQRLRSHFFQLVQTHQGKVTPLQLAIAAQLDGTTAKQYLSDRSIEYEATFVMDADGNLTYCFHLGEISDQPFLKNDCELFPQRRPNVGNGTDRFS
ncbi:MAG: hypothetical protein AAF892_15595 [Cyanobacteria bacterium P01_D01_bin.71]